MRRDGWLATAIALAGDLSPDTATTRLRLERQVLLAWGTVRTIVWATLDTPLDATLLVVTAIVLATALALAFTPRFEAIASRLALPALLVQLAATLPVTPNHFFLELYATMILALADREGEDAGLVLAGLRWLTVIVLFVTGCQKLAWGHYVHGDFLAFMVGRGDRFADLFAWVLPATEIARLQSYDPFRGGSGPYRVTAPAFVLMSNAVWIAELVLPAALLVPRTRAAATALAVVFVLAVQLGAREMGFAILFANLLMAFAPVAASRIVATVSLAMLAVVGGMAVGVVPGGALVRAWHLW